MRKNNKKFFVYKAVALIVVLSIIAIIFMFNSLNDYIYGEKQKTEVQKPYKATLSGTYLCLEQKESIEGKQEKCVFGLKTEVGEYYLIDFNLMSQSISNLWTDTRIKANGVLTPIEYLSTNHWQKYNVKGVFSVTDSLEEIN